MIYRGGSRILKRGGVRGAVDLGGGGGRGAVDLGGGGGGGGAHPFHIRMLNEGPVVPS